MHESYEKRLGHPADFRVRYRFYEEEEGGRKTMPHQGIRTDFSFEQPCGLRGNFIIWPEFEGADGNIILDETIPVNKNGTARMWIINNERRIIHRDNIKIGLKGYFLEGKRTAECTVIEILGLRTNPTTNKRA